MSRIFQCNFSENLGNLNVSFVDELRELKSLSETTIRPSNEGSHLIILPSGNYGVPDAMLHGFKKTHTDNSPGHPLEYSEKHWHENKRMMDFNMLRNMQGLHAPLKLQMELKITRQMLRLPGLPSSNVLENSLTGRDEIIELEDIFNVAEEREVMSDSHIQMEKLHNIL